MKSFVIAAGVMLGSLLLGIAMLTGLALFFGSVLPHLPGLRTALSLGLDVLVLVIAWVIANPLLAYVTFLACAIAWHAIRLAEKLERK